MSAILSKPDLRRVLQEAQQIAKEESIPKEDALDEAYRRLGFGRPSNNPSQS